MHFHFKSQLFVVLAIAAFAVTCGCNDGRGKRVPVSGKVTVGGQVLEFGSISFTPVISQKGSRAGGGTLGEGGTFRVTSYTAYDGLLPGQYKVAVSAIEPINDASQRWHAPQRYASLEDSGLTIDIDSQTDSANFELTWEGDDHSKPYVENF